LNKEIEGSWFSYCRDSRFI